MITTFAKWRKALREFKPRQKSTPAKKPKHAAKRAAKTKAPAVSRVVAETSPKAFVEKLENVKRKIDALPRPKKNFMDGGDGLTGRGWLTLPNVKDAVSVGGNEWNSKMQEAAIRIIRDAFGPDASLRIDA